MILNEHQWRLVNNMVESIRSFREGQLQFYNLIGNLEGALDAGDFSDSEMIKEWYELWTPLEILRAQKGNNVTVEDVDRYLSDMIIFLDVLKTR
jgi:hypothetical protein